MNKQAQADRIVIYVLAVFIAGTILIYGYTVVKGLLITQEQVQLLDFEKQLKDEVKSLSFSFRDVKEERFMLPSSYNLICFVNLDVPDVSTKISDSYVLIKDSVTDGVKRNVFLLSDEKMRYGFYAGQVGVNINNKQDFACLNVTNGDVKIRLEALGRKVSVSGW